MCLASWMRGHSTAPFSDGKRRFRVLRPLESSASSCLRVPVIATPSYPNPGRAWIRFCDRSSASIQGPHSGAAGSLLLKYRIVAANEEHGNYILTAFFQTTFLTGKCKTVPTV